MKTLNLKKFEIPSATTYKLDGIRKVAFSLDHPELGRPTLLVAGTNGKGSVCAYLTALAVSAGKKVGTYSSPHVVHPEERIRINGKPISRSLLRAYERRYEKILSSLTFFERWTILGFLIFRDLKVDLQIVEVGMGGRLDATNICEPDLSFITSIDYDHQEVLGDTLKQIAFEKAGIMRSGRPVIAHSQTAEAMSTLKEIAYVRRAHLMPIASAKIPSSLRSHFEKIKMELGSHQKENALAALYGWGIFCKQLDWKNKLSSSQMRRSLSNKSLWPARLQIISRTPYFLVDGGHNPHAVKALVQFLRKLAVKKWTLIFGMMGDKDVEPVIAALKPFTERVILPSYYPEREISPYELEKFWKKENLPAHIPSDLPSALRRCLYSKEPILVAGSFYLAGAVLSELESLKGRKR